jgi:hypothetical protein
VARLKYFDDDFDEHSVRGVGPSVDDPKPFQLVDEKDSSYKSRRVRALACGKPSSGIRFLPHTDTDAACPESSLEVLDAASLVFFGKGYTGSCMSIRPLYILRAGCDHEGPQPSYADAVRGAYPGSCMRISENPLS